MGALDKVASTLEAGAKALRRSQLRFPGRSFVHFDFLGRSSVSEMRRQVGDGTTSDVLTTPVRWLQRVASEAPLAVLDAEGDPLPDSQLQGLLDRPNDFFSPQQLLAATFWDLLVDGNAYWICIRDGNGRPAELWWAPAWSIHPEWPDNGTVFISHYEYHVHGRVLNLPPEDVLHFREGADPRNMRKGMSPIRGLLREIFTDDEAATFTASLLMNSGVPGLILSPSNTDHTITQEEGDAAEAKLGTKFTREGRGKPIVLTGPTQLHQFGFSPQQLDLSALRDVSEERVTAALGVPAAVVGFGAGLQSTKVGATMRELVQLAWHNGVIPRQRIIAGEITRSLIDVFPGNAEKVEFDLSDVQALREDQNALATRMERLVRSGVITRAMAQTELGFDPVDSDDVYLIQLSTIEVPRGANGSRAQIVEAQVEERRLLTSGEKKNHSPQEERIVGAAPRARRIPRRVQRFVAALDRIRGEAPEAFAVELQTFFDDLGAEAERIILEALEQRGELEARADSQAPETKQDGTLVEEVLAFLDLLAKDAELRRIFERQFGSIADEVAAEMSAVLGVEFVFSDPAQVNILRQGGLRAGLIDLDAQTRDALFDALADARAEGLASENLARRIRDRVSAGPWRDAATRARVIARTEGANAANTATLQTARDMTETEHVLVTDDRIGFGDPDCVAANGRVITIQEAESIGLAHPNCTRAFTPVNSLLLEELDLEAADGGRRLREPI